MSTFVPSAVKLREYEKLFFGTNQLYGYENPFLEFWADTAAITLFTDKVTYFHYPLTGPTIPVSGSGLIESGAVAGSIPYNSDKLWKKNADYKRFIRWGNSSKPDTGVWLCTWLSGNMNNSNSVPVWKDRWYNPGYIDLSGAFLTNSLSSVVIDLDSQITFEPGVWYKYFHVGDDFNLQLVNELSGSSGSLKVLLNNWNNLTTIDSLSNTLIFNGGKNVVSNIYEINGTNQNCQVLFNNSLELRDKITYATWVYARDWNNVKGNTIIGKNFRGGWDLKFNNGFFNPIFATFDQIGNAAFGDSKGSIYFSKTLPGSSNPVAAGFDSNLFTWVLDNGLYQGSKHLYKMDYNGDIVSYASITSTAILKDLTIDGNGIVWILDTNTNTVSGFYSNCTCLYSQALTSSNVTRIDIDTQNYLHDYQASGLCIDNTDNAWFVSNDVLYKTTQYGLCAMHSGSNLSEVACDKDNNIWLLQNANEYIKFTNSGELITSGSTGTSTSSGIRSICFTKEYDDTTSTYKDYVWFSYELDQTIYKYDTSGNLEKRVLLAPFSLSPTVRTFTSYDWNRKFNYLSIGEQPRIDAEIFLGTIYEPSSGKYVLYFPVSGLSNNDWHHFAFSYDNEIGQANFYVDSVLRQTTSIPVSAKIFYNYENSIFVGTNAGKTDNLDEEIDSEVTHFKGKIDDVRVYDCILTNFELWNIYKLKFDYEDIIWNMSTGEQVYLEEIERFFKFKLPGSKSQYFNIKLIGLNISDPSVRLMIEDIIRNIMKKLVPAHAELLNIVWE